PRALRLRPADLRIPARARAADGIERGDARRDPAADDHGWRRRRHDARASARRSGLATRTGRRIDRLAAPPAGDDGGTTQKARERIEVPGFSTYSGGEGVRI